MKKQDGRLQHEAVKDSNRQPENETKESRSEYDRLLLWMKTGDMEAFRLLYEKTAGNVYGYALSILKNTQDAEEVMQDTYLVVWNRVEAYEPDGKPMAWLFTIARNLCYMKLRRQNAVSSVSLEEMREQETGWEPGTLCRDIELAPEKQVLLELLKTLKEEERSVILLHVASGMKHREIAEALNLPLSTVLSRYRRAIKKLEDQLEA